VTATSGEVSVAALFVQKNGHYYGLPGVDPWDEVRDARTYAGPHPVVAHPPCSRWCKLANINQKRYGHKVGDDGGCFEAALSTVRTWGGVLEHPAYTRAWNAFGLPRPPRAGWSRSICGGWTCEVSQAAYGHRAEKMTWLYYSGDAPPPSLDWSRPKPSHLVSYCNNTQNSGLPRLSKREASRTPLAFRDMLLSIARGARVFAEAA
jgi:hypothetical protein